jgi:hypothetical protein
MNRGQHLRGVAPRIEAQTEEKKGASTFSRLPIWRKLHMLPSYFNEK